MPIEELMKSYEKEMSWDDPVQDMKEIQNMDDATVLSSYTTDEIIEIGNKQNPTEQELAIKDRYISAVNKQEEDRISKEVADDYREYGQHEYVSEDSDISYGDLEKLAQTITTTLKDPKIRF
jgi:hypothetical protein